MATLTRALVESFENENEFERLETEYQSNPDFGDLQLDITMALLKLQYGDADWFVPNLIRYLKADPQQHELAHAVLNLSFPVTDDMIACDVSLNSIQRNALDAIIENEFVWKWNPEFGAELTSRGLPANRQDLRDLRTSMAG